MMHRSQLRSWKNAILLVSVVLLTLTMVLPTYHSIPIPKSMAEKTLKWWAFRDWLIWKKHQYQLCAYVYEMGCPPPHLQGPPPPSRPLHPYNYFGSSMAQPQITFTSTSTPTPISNSSTVSTNVTPTAGAGTSTESYYTTAHAPVSRYQDIEDDQLDIYFYEDGYHGSEHSDSESTELEESQDYY